MYAGLIPIDEIGWKGRVGSSHSDLYLWVLSIQIHNDIEIQYSSIEKDSIQFRPLIEME